MHSKPLSYQNSKQLHEAPENLREQAPCMQVTIGFGLTSDWLRKWCKFFKPITKRSNAKPKVNANYFRHSCENRSNLTYNKLFMLSFHEFVPDSDLFFSYYRWICSTVQIYFVTYAEWTDQVRIPEKGLKDNHSRLHFILGKTLNRVVFLLEKSHSPRFMAHWCTSLVFTKTVSCSSTVNSRLANTPLLRTKFRSPSKEVLLKITPGITDSCYSRHKMTPRRCPL